MSIVKMNAITVPADSGDELARRFAARAGALDGVDGFLGFELLQPTDGRTTWLVVTRWLDEATYDAWVASANFAAGHGRGDDGEGRPRPLAVASEVWSFAVAGGSSEA
ncbi:antibiotic biosynthesis monooxygenase [Georgenia yuyongxinii]|uniref:Antibiotic biosynthesis monooxygenase n=1 Tax=Georgenia yuyongxinii TaxID=2589797 RepID=A0A5B8CDR8_9MICO|nr:antibiotic biosynthesis monooxygenase [Georgenia yuyongxinii]QDC26346.1 antibiotic biosynthesis monooxygenase [Georgenia yuyongxinii]